MSHYRRDVVGRGISTGLGLGLRRRLSGGALPVLFGWNPETAAALPATSTFTRASIAQVLTTTDDTTNWYQEAKSGELRLDGLRRVENLNDLADLDSWIKTGIGTGDIPIVTTGFGSEVIEGVTTSTFRLQCDLNGGGSGADRSRIENSVFIAIGKFFTVSIFARSLSGGAQTFRLTAGGTDLVTIPSTGFVRLATFSELAGGGGTSIQLGLVGSDVGTSDTLDIELAAVQFERTQTADESPGPYADIATEYLNIGVNGARYFNTTNGNSVDGNGVVTEATGTTITGGGYLPEPAATNRMLHSNDLTDAVWVASGAAGAADLGVTDIGGNSSRLTGVGALGVDDVVQTATGFTASGAIAPSFLLRRVSTTGTLRIVQATDGATGGDWDIDLSTIGAGWVRIEPGSTLLTENTAWTASGAGAAGVTFAASTGGPLSVDIAFVGQEDTAFANSPIITSGSTVTRVADTLTTGVNAGAATSFLVDATAPAVAGSTAPSLAAVDGSSDDRVAFINDTSILSEADVQATITNDIRGERHKIAASWEQVSGGLIVVDDESNSATGTPTAAPWDGADMTIGYGGSTQYWRGRIHNFVHYGAAQTQSELEALTA